MNILLWVLQVLTALLYGASGVMNVFLFDKISGDVPSFGALPRRVWMALCASASSRSAGGELPAIDAPRTVAGKLTRR